MLGGKAPQLGYKKNPQTYHIHVGMEMPTRQIQLALNKENQKSIFLHILVGGCLQNQNLNSTEISCSIVMEWFVLKGTVKII